MTLTKWIAVLGLAACTGRQGVVPVPMEPPRDVRAIYEAVLRESLSNRAHPIVVDVTLAYEPPLSDSIRDGRRQPPVLLRTRLAEMSAQEVVGSPAAFIRDVELLSPHAAVQRGEAGLGGTRILGVSRIAFTDDSSYALVYRSVTCGPLCGNDAELWFAKRNGEWILERTITHAVR